DAIPPDHRRSMAASGHRRLPGDIMVMTPGGWQVFQRGNTVGGGAAPSRPIVRAGDRTCGGSERQKRKQCEAQTEPHGKCNRFDADLREKSWREALRIGSYS